MRRIKPKIKFNSAYEYSLYLLSFCGRSESSLRKRLEMKKYPAGEISAAIKKLKQYNFIDDERTAQQIISFRFKTGKGARAVRAELLQKGFGIDIINSQIEQAEKESPSEVERALIVAQKRSSGWKNLSDQKKRDRLVSLLNRHGFLYDTIKEVLKKEREYED